MTFDNISYMIYTESSEYAVRFYEVRPGYSPVLEFIRLLPALHRAKVIKYIGFLRQHHGVLDEPYSKHIKGKLRELRVDFGKNRYRIFYFLFIGKAIVILHGFLKKTAQTPLTEIKIAEEYYQDIINH